MSEEEQIKKIRKIRNISIITIILIDILMIILILIRASSDNCSGYAGLRMSQQEKDIYNSKIKPYLVETVKGHEVRSMLETIISMNQENINQDRKFISVQVENIKAYDEEDKERLEKICKICNENKNNNEENVKKATQEITKLEKKIQSSKKYTVEAEYKEGIIYKVTIMEIEKRNEEEDDE